MGSFIRFMQSKTGCSIPYFEGSENTIMGCTRVDATAAYVDRI